VATTSAPHTQVAVASSAAFGVPGVRPLQALRASASLQAANHTVAHWTSVSISLSLDHPTGDMLCFVFRIMLNRYLPEANTATVASNVYESALLFVSTCRRH
jgi:hypothetical protein